MKTKFKVGDIVIDRGVCYNGHYFIFLIMNIDNDYYRTFCFHESKMCDFGIFSNLAREAELLCP